MGEGHLQVLQPKFPFCRVESSDSTETAERTHLTLKLQIPKTEGPLGVGPKLGMGHEASFEAVIRFYHQHQWHSE